MRSPKIALFAYNFPHRKTQEFIYKLLSEGQDLALIIAADPVKLSIPPSVVKTKIRHTGHMEPSRIAEAFNLTYEVAVHNSEATVELIKKHDIDIGVIAGARILKQFVIEAFPTGIINFHPGLIPESRGLDALLWSIHNDVPLGVTSHLIDKKVDSGKILVKEEIPIYPDDTIFDFSERLYEYQIKLMIQSIQRAVNGDWQEVPNSSEYNRKMPADLEKQTLLKVQDYIDRHSKQ